ncbi:MAG: hypothetical protein ACJ73S_14855 [Mycobacteriales bacterium]
MTREDVDVDTAHYVALGSASEASGAEGRGVGPVDARRDVVDFAVGWLKEHRQGGGRHAR